MLLIFAKVNAVLPVNGSCGKTYRKTVLHITVRVIIKKNKFYFQGESDDCVNRIAVKDGLFHK